jgi:hypothetical protein
MDIRRRSIYVSLILALATTACSRAGTDDQSRVANSTTPTYVTQIEATLTATAQPSASTPTQKAAIPTGSPAPSLEPSPTPSWIGPDQFPQNVNPLTGIEVSDPSRLERRPVMIKVSNYPAYLRPHSGLSFADLVWEYYIGVGMTRFLALYYGNDAPQIGPVRSGRLIDPQLVQMYGGLLGLVSADSYVWQVIKGSIPTRYISEKPLTCPALCRESAEHSVFADSSAFSEYAEEIGLDNQRQDLPGMVFDNQVPEGGAKAGSIWIYISYYDQVMWEFDGTEGAYLRFQESDQGDGTVVLAPLTDRLTGEQLQFANVVFLFTKHEEIKPELIDMDLIHAEGRRALIMRDGLIFEGSYTAVSPTKPLRFFDRGGNAFPFKPGKTWFLIVGEDSTLEEFERGAWKMRFYP